MKEAIVAVIRKGERVLVIKRGPETVLSGYWSPPSGRIEDGETQPETVIREVREELGLEVRPIAKIWECPTDDGGFLLHWWTVEVTGGSLVLDPGEVGDAVWVTAEEFRSLEPTFVGDHEFFDEVLPGLDAP